MTRDERRVDQRAFWASVKGTGKFISYGPYACCACCEPDPPNLGHSVPCSTCSPELLEKS